MANLVERILTISKRDNQELKLNRIRIDLEDFLTEQTEILQRITEGKELQCRLEDTGVFAESRAEVCLRQKGGWAVIMVENDGAEISEEEFPHIFERFYQGKNRNFGIGLSVV